MRNDDTAGEARLHRQIAGELGVRDGQVRAAVELLDGGATVPFIARYRKEVTGTLDDVQLRALEERLRYLRELEERRAAILESVRAQGKLDDEIAARIAAADSKARLEDIYLPFKPKRRTKAQIAREAGLEPLAEGILADPSVDPAHRAAGYVSAERGVPDAAAALDGARAIFAEWLGDDADLVGELRERMWSRGRAVSSVRPGREESGAKFADYFAFSEALTTLPSHRILALFRGEKEEVLDVALDPGEPPAYEAAIHARTGIRDQGRPGDRWLVETARWAWRTRVVVRLDLDLRVRLRQKAEDEAARVFAANLRDLLLAAPAGARVTMGLDPGLRTGVKVAVVDATGKVLATDTIYPHEPRRRWDESLATLAALAHRHGVSLVAIGNGTASRETDKLVAELIARHPSAGLSRVTVSEAGASVYSASAYASRELPELDVSLRGAVSIARRLQDPLAELVKIDPKSIGVGQYQHDIPEQMLSRSLDAVVEDCVNGVGVDVNTASVPLLARVSGVGPALAENIVAFRDGHGAFPSRKALTAVPRLGPKAFEQCAGFLRVADGTEPLDRSGVHPEAYPVVRRIAASVGAEVGSLLGSPVVRTLDPSSFVDGAFGLPTVTDILAELEKPGRDPRPEFRTATFAEGVEKVADLRPGMVLEGVVTNVAAFGAFVDVGVHQDGLVHVSAMSRSYVRDPRDVVKSGDVVRVKVTAVDVPRNRIGLTLRLDEPAPGRGSGERPAGPRGDSGPGSGPGSGRGGRGAGPGDPGSGDSRSVESGPGSGRGRGESGRGESGPGSGRGRGESGRGESGPGSGRGGGESGRGESARGDSGRGESGRGGRGELGRGESARADSGRGGRGAGPGDPGSGDSRSVESGLGSGRGGGEPGRGESGRGRGGSGGDASGRGDSDRGDRGRGRGGRGEDRRPNAGGRGRPGAEGGRGGSRAGGRGDGGRGDGGRGDGGRGDGGRGEGGRGRGDGRRAAEPSGAMADALRRAGLAPDAFREPRG